MFDHVGIKVKNLAASLRFYDAALAPLGFERCSSSDEGAGYGPPGAPALWLYAAEPAGAGVHIAFAAAERRAVDAFHRSGVANGGHDYGAPGLRPDYSPTYYAAFLLDPDGNNVEAVCLTEVV